MLPKFIIIFILFNLIILPRQIQAQGSLAEITAVKTTNEPAAEFSTVDQQSAELSSLSPITIEEQKTILIIDQATVKKGYSAQSPDKNFILGLHPNILTANLKVEIEEKENSGNLPASANLLSKIYTFRLTLDNQPVILSKFFPLIINLTGNNPDESLEAGNKNQNNRKTLYSFLTPQNKWIALKARITSEKAIAQIDFSQATVAVFSAQDQASLPPEMQIAAAVDISQNLADVNNNGQEKNNQTDRIADSNKDGDQEQKFTIYLGDDIIEKGYTVAYPGQPDQQLDEVDLMEIGQKPADSNNPTDAQTAEPPIAEFKIAILPNILSKSVNLQIKKYAKDDFSALPVEDENYQIMTDVYEYTFYDALIKLEKDKKLILAINGLPPDQYNKKAVFFLDETINKWRPLPSNYYNQQNSIRAFAYFPYAKVAVFQNNKIKIGQASWFADRLSSVAFGAASNDFPQDTVLKIINLKNNKSIKVKVISSGPFVAGRVIDLTYSAFAAIANPKYGVIKVKAEKAE